MPPVLPLTDDSANLLPWSSSTKSSKTTHNWKLLSACLMATLPHKAERTMGPNPCILFGSVSVRAALKFTDVAGNSLHCLRFLNKTRAKTIQRQIHVLFFGGVRGAIHNNNCAKEQENYMASWGTEALAYLL